MSGRGTAEERSGWTDTDRCWWCGVARQTREHLFKECRTWEGEVTLWYANVSISTFPGNVHNNTKERCTMECTWNVYGMYMEVYIECT